VQDKEVDRELADKNPALHARVAGDMKASVFGSYRAIDEAKVKDLSSDEKETVTKVREAAKKNALKTVALFPVGMLIAYLLLILYFKSKGGYAPVSLGDNPPAH